MGAPATYQQIIDVEGWRPVAGDCTGGEPTR
jgi:hypothetical protein